MLKGVPDFEMLREEQEGEKRQLRGEKRSSKCFKLEVTSAELAQPIFIQSDLYSFLDIVFLRSLSSQFKLNTKTKQKQQSRKKLQCYGCLTLCLRDRLMLSYYLSF